MKAKFSGENLGGRKIGASPIKEKEKLLIKLLYEKGLKSVEIAKQLNRHTTTICRILKSMDISTQNYLKITESEIQDITKLYNQGLTIEKIYEIYKEKVSMGGITYHLKKLGISRPNGRQVQLDHNYFEDINTEAKAYYLGFITADGSVVKHKKSKNGFSHFLRMELKVEDKYILEKLTEELKSNLPVRECMEIRNKQGWKNKHDAYVTFYSKKMFDDLGKYGVVQNKTLKLRTLPDIAPDMMRHYIRGYFDGDGTVYYNKTQQRRIFGFYGTYDFVSNINDFLFKEIGLNKRKVTKQKDANVSFVTYSTIENIESFYEYIYDKSSIYLFRKKEKFDKYRI